MANRWLRDARAEETGWLGAQFHHPPEEEPGQNKNKKGFGNPLFSVKGCPRAIHLEMSWNGVTPGVLRDKEDSRERACCKEGRGDAFHNGILLCPQGHFDLPGMTSACCTPWPELRTPGIQGEGLLTCAVRGNPHWPSGAGAGQLQLVGRALLPSAGYSSLTPSVLTLGRGGRWSHTALSCPRPCLHSSAPCWNRCWGSVTAHLRYALP